MTRPRWRWALAALLLAAGSASARAQVPAADTARRDTTARRDSSSQPDSAAAVRADSAPVVRHLTDLGASVRPGSALYRVFVVAPRQAPPLAPPRADSAGGVAPVATADSVRPVPAVRDSARLPTPLAIHDSADSADSAARAATALPGARVDSAGGNQVVVLDTTDLGIRSTSLTATTYAGAPAWLMVSAGGRGVRTAIDSLIVAQSDLRPLHLGGTVGLTRVAIELPGDSAFAAMSDPTGRRSVVVPVPRDAILSGEMLAALLQVLPLASGWSDSVHVAVIAPPTITVDPAVLMVVGEDTTSTPLGPAPSWVVVLHSPSAEAKLWVTRDTRVVMREEQTLPSAQGATLLRVYVGGTTP